MRRYLVLLPILLLWACKPPEESHMKVVIGAVMMDGLGGPPVSNSVVVVSGNEIREVGTSSNIPIPAEADKIDGGGRFLAPGLVDVCAAAEPRGMIQAESADEARKAVAAVIAGHAPAIHIGKMPPAAMQAALEAAREASLPILGHIATQAEAKSLVDRGVSGLVGMIRDTEDLDPGLLNRLRDLKIVVAPALASLPAGSGLEMARRNTARMFKAGVLLAAASAGADLQREAEALADAGIPPLDVIVAATHNSALALHQADRAGSIQPGHEANLLLLSANPGEDIRNLRRVAGRFVAGEWSQK
ncbi:MAG TPA: amidohydrolase family protein [Candidatus Sulfopaludibacter sp.]|jgi:imidazolonepropionase-like amidohydrolase|nr:amidohydrolase family protein [Candidatus Sulfopaludibacter sp.]